MGYNSETINKFPRQLREKFDRKINDLGNTWYRLAERKIKLEEEYWNIIKEIDWEEDIKNNWKEHHKQNKALDNIKKGIDDLEQKKDEALAQDMYFSSIVQEHN